MSPQRKSPQQAKNLRPLFLRANVNVVYGCPQYDIRPLVISKGRTKKLWTFAFFLVTTCNDFFLLFHHFQSCHLIKKNFGPFIKDDINERGRERVCQKRTFSRQGEGGVVCGRLMINANEWGWPGGVKKYKILN